MIAFTNCISIPLWSHYLWKGFRSVYFLFRLLAKIKCNVWTILLFGAYSMEIFPVMWYSKRFTKGRRHRMAQCITPFTDEIILSQWSFSHCSVTNNIHGGLISFLDRTNSPATPQFYMRIVPCFHSLVSAIIHFVLPSLILSHLTNSYYRLEKIYLKVH